MLLIIPFVYLMLPKLIGDEFFLEGLVGLFISSLIFFLPVFILLALVRFLIANKISYLVNFLLFESYGYFLIVLPLRNEERFIIQSNSLLYVIYVKYFIYSIPMTTVFLIIWFLIDTRYIKKLIERSVIQPLSKKCRR